MVNDFKILDNISNDVVVCDYLTSEKNSRKSNKGTVSTFAVATIILCGTGDMKAMNVEPSFLQNYDYSRTELVKNQSDYLNYYIQKVNELTTPLVIKDEIIQEILSFKSLKENWDGYGAIPLEVQSASNALSILNKIDDKSISKINEIYPNTHGTVTIEFENQNLEKLNLEIGNNSFAYYLELNNMEVSFFNNLSFSNENIKELIKNIQSI